MDSAGAKPENLGFSAEFNSPGSDYHEDWSFIVDRLSGTGTLRRQGKPDTPFACTKARPKF